MAALLPPSECQFIDADGHPYAGGTLETYVPGTTTLKATWADPNATVLNPNPIVLDSAGRCIVYGDGLYRCILSDVGGNEIWDQPSSTLVSVAMAPVVIAPDLATARRLMGIDDAIQVETDRAIAAEQNLQSEINGLVTTTQLNDEVARAKAAEAQLQANIDAEKARAMAAEAALGQSLPGMRVGFGQTDASGTAVVTFTAPFANACDGIVATADPHSWCNITGQSKTGFTCTTSSPLFGGNWIKGPIGFYYIAFGH
jgi:hypothetical protein